MEEKNQKTSETQTEKLSEMAEWNKKATELIKQKNDSDVPFQDTMSKAAKKFIDMAEEGLFGAGGSAGNPIRSGGVLDKNTNFRD